MSKSLLAWVGVVCLSLVACSSSSGSSSSDSERESAILALSVDLTAGQTLYTSNCASCHGSDAKSGTENINIASIAASNETLVIDTMLSGKEEMPSFSSLDNQSLANILGYVQSLN